MNILITGGAGFIGSHLIDEFLRRGHSVAALDNLANGSMENLREADKSANFKFIKGDILNKEDCEAASRNIDAVYHLACLGVRHSIHSPFENHRVNAEGTLNMLEVSLKNNIKKFFYISTSEIYGAVKTFPINEGALPCPLTVYGASKLAGELYTNVYNKCYGVDTTILRIFNNYGPRAHYEGDAGEIIPRSIVNILYGSPPVIFGDGSVTRDFFFVKDTARALSGLIDLPDLNGITMNIGAGTEITMKHLTEKILEAMNKKELGMLFMDSRPADVPRLWVDAGKFYAATGFDPGYTLATGLPETIAYYEELAKTKDLLSGIKVKNWEKV